MKDEEIARLNISNYCVKTFFSRKNTSKGGVMILSEEGFELKRVSVPKSLKNRLLEERQFEFCACSYSISTFKFIVITVYRSPNSDVNIFLDRLNILVDYFSKRFVKIIVAGDLNIDVLINDNKHKLLKQVLKSHNMRYLVTFPTRIAETSSTAIDNFLIKNLGSNIINIEGLITSLSDHDGQLLEINAYSSLNCKKLPVKQEVRKFSQENVQYFSQLLIGETWMDVYLATVQEKYSIFHKTFTSCFEKAFPKTLITKTKKTDSWITNDLKTKRAEIIQLTKEFRKNKSSILKDFLKNENDKYKQELNHAKTEYFQKQINNSSNIQKTVWKIINSEIGEPENRSSDNLCLNVGSQSISDPYLVSNVFNDYFVNIVEDLDSGKDKHDLSVPTCIHIENTVSFKPKFNFEPLDEREVENIIRNLKNKHSYGYDEIPITLIKDVSKYISKIICHLINSSFVSGIFPNELKKAKVIPIYKKDDKKQVNNYRPVSILPSLSKIFEKAAHIQLTKFLEKFNFLDNNQHGFRSGRSVVSAAISFIESVIESLDEGKLTTGIFMDLSKAFDSVKHSKLVEKLHEIGLTKNALNWFKSYLSDRSQFVEITYLKNNKIFKVPSKLKPLKFGVPQGSILGPLLFICYLREIDSALLYKLNSELCLYADDSNLMLSTNSLEQTEVCAFAELESIGQFLKSHNLLLNPQKTNFICFKTRRNKAIEEPILTFDSHIIDRKEFTNFLGLSIDQNLNWNEHVHKILLKINSGIYALSKMSFYCNLQTLKNIYFAHVHSHISYCIGLYGSTTKGNMDNILKQQKRAIRIMLGLKWDESAKIHFKNLRILTVYGQYIYETILIAKNDMHNKNFELPTHSYNTRNRNEIVPAHRLTFFEKKPSYAGMKFLKKIPASIKNQTNIIKFKKLLKEYLTDLSIYSVDEFSTLP